MWESCNIMTQVSQENGDNMGRILFSTNSHHQGVDSITSK